MSLNIQIMTFSYSFLYGFLFSFILDIIYKYIFKLKKILQMIFILLFVLINSIIYFIILESLNYGILHPYYVIAFVTGFFIFYAVRKLIVFLIKK